MTWVRPPWSEPVWRAEAETWIADRLDDLEIRPTAPVVEYRVRFWSVLLTVETDHGRYWFKENAPAQAFEAELLSVLSRLSPGRVLEPAAIDRATGRLLTADRGTTLREAGPTGADAWQRLMTTYAQIQRAAPAEQLTEVALTRMDPIDAGAYVESWVAHWRRLDEPHPSRMAAETATRILSWLPQIADWGHQLAGSGLPLTVEHSDLHTNNAFVGADDTPLIFDFGDAVVGHPLCSLLVPVRAMRFAEDGTNAMPDTEVDRVIDAYLEVFSDLVPMTELRALLPAALQIGILNRHESWRRALDTADPSDPSYADFASAPAEWLAELGGTTA